MMLLLARGSARACGGLACAVTPLDPEPVIQNGEKIVFAIQPDGMVDVHVQVAYEGPPDDFAWIVPVSTADPEVFL